MTDGFPLLFGRVLQGLYPLAIIFLSLILTSLSVKEYFFSLHHKVEHKSWNVVDTKEMLPK